MIQLPISQKARKPYVMPIHTIFTIIVIRSLFIIISTNSSYYIYLLYYSNTKNKYTYYIFFLVFRTPLTILKFIGKIFWIFLISCSFISSVTVSDMKFANILWELTLFWWMQWNTFKKKSNFQSGRKHIGRITLFVVVWMMTTIQK